MVDLKISSGLHTSFTNRPYLVEDPEIAKVAEQMLLKADLGGIAAFSDRSSKKLFFNKFQEKIPKKMGRLLSFS